MAAVQRLPESLEREVCLGYFDNEPMSCRKRNVVERAVNKLRGTRAVATRYDKRDFVYRGNIDVAAIRIWLRDPSQPDYGTRPSGNSELQRPRLSKPDGHSRPLTRRSRGHHSRIRVGRVEVVSCRSLDDGEPSSEARPATTPARLRWASISQVSAPSEN